jgi:heme exporter protein D
MISWAWFALALIPLAIALAHSVRSRRSAGSQVEQLGDRLRILHATLEERIAAQTSQLAEAAEIAESANRATAPRRARPGATCRSSR